MTGKSTSARSYRVEVGDLRQQSLAEIWNSPRYVELRQKLLEHGIFPVCRRCCKVELDYSNREALTQIEPVGTRALAAVNFFTKEVTLLFPTLRVRVPRQYNPQVRGRI